MKLNCWVLIIKYFKFMIALIVLDLPKQSITISFLQFPKDNISLELNLHACPSDIFFVNLIPIKGGKILFGIGLRQVPVNVVSKGES